MAGILYPFPSPPPGSSVFDHFNDRVTGDLPWTEMDFKSVSDTLYSRTISGRVQTRSFSMQYFEWKAIFTPMTDLQIRPIFALAHSLSGRNQAFTITLPTTPHIGTIVQGTASGTAGSRSLTLDTITNFSGNGNLKAGDLINFSSDADEHYKVYMVTEDMSITGGAGTGTVNIFPGLIKTISTPATFYTGQNIKFLARMKNDIQTYNRSADGFYRYDIEMEETF